MFYVGRDFITSAHQAERLPFECGHCGYKGKARAACVGFDSAQLGDFDASKPLSGERSFDAIVVFAEYSVCGN